MNDADIAARPIDPDRIMMLVGGFQASQALYVAAKLDVATLVCGGPRTVEELAVETGADADSLWRIIRFLAMFGLFRTSGDRIETTELGALLSGDHPHSIRQLALYTVESQYAAFGELLHSAMTGEPAAAHVHGKAYFDWISADPEMAELQNRAFAENDAVMRPGLLDGYALPAGATVVDVGGADGSTLARLLADAPERRGVVFDRPEVVAAARARWADRALADRVEFVGGDFFRSVPPGDVYLLSFIMHNWDDVSCLRILRSIRDAAEPGARLVLIETVMPPGDHPHLAKAIDLTMLALTGGRERSAEEFRALLAAAGFILARVVPSTTPYSFVEATLG